MKAKAKWLSGLGVLMAAALLGVKLWAADVRVVNANGIQGTVVKARTAEKWRLQGIQSMTQSFWTPELRDIEVVESRLHAALEAKANLSNSSRAYRAKTIERVLKRYGGYSRQYVGVVIDGKRYIFLNSFPATYSMDAQKHYVIVDDGGEAFWRILYSVEDGQFSEFSANGSA